MDLNSKLVFVFISFWSLTFLTILKKNDGSNFLEKIKSFRPDKEILYIDLISLMFQGFFIPMIQSVALVKIYLFFFPSSSQILSLSFWEGFLLEFIIVDYLYYWNHRWLHSKELWRIHRLHHSVEKMDPWASSRNSFITPFFIVYVWVHSILIYLLKDSQGLLWAIAFSNSLDLWRHSEFFVKGKLRQVLGIVLILPQDHYLHHTVKFKNKNFGANLNWWDKIHSTFEIISANNERIEDMKLGDKKVRSSLMKQFLNPWSR